MTAKTGSNEKRFLGTKAAAEYSGIPASTLRVWRSQVEDRDSTNPVDARCMI